MPMGPDAIANIWRLIKPYNFNATHGALSTWDVYGDDLKERILHSAKIWIQNMGHPTHPLLLETV
jgi:hypothetical protein